MTLWMYWFDVVQHQKIHNRLIVNCEMYIQNTSYLYFTSPFYNEKCNKTQHWIFYIIECENRIDEYLFGVTAWIKLKLWLQNCSWTRKNTSKLQKIYFYCKLSSVIKWNLFCITCYCCVVHWNIYAKIQQRCIHLTENL